MAATCFGLLPSSGSLQLSLAKFILILSILIKIYVKLDRSYMFRSTTIIRELAIVPG